MGKKRGTIGACRVTCGSSHANAEPGRAILYRESLARDHAQALSVRFRINSAMGLLDFGLVHWSIEPTSATLKKSASLHHLSGGLR
jgi:hypothetical protein